jgi:hypothetical protein
MMILFILHKLDVDLMLHPAGNSPLLDLAWFTGLIPIFWFFHDTFPGVAFLATHKLKGAVARMIGRAAISQ